MIYLGHFSFDKEPTTGAVEDQSYHGCFTTVAEAENVEEVMEKFEALIRRLHDEDDVFDGVNEVFLDTCVECRAIPQSGFLAHFVEWVGEEVGSISTSIRGATHEEATAYHIQPDDPSDDSDGHEVEPFVVFAD
ncbi:MAG: hypothetical protein NUW23_10620 [Firmicutes bacterium]|nr:hypothetical protein [Bacillota bacterium]